MKKTWLACLLTLVVWSLQAQEETREFTDDELISYATVMVWVEGEKVKMTDAYNSWIQENDSIEAAKFSEMLKANKSGTLGEVEATESELAAFNSIEAKNEQQQAEFKEVFIGKIKEDITVSLYNDLGKALKKDEALKARYQTIFDELLAEANPEGEEVEEAGAGS
ncbi:MAG: hypothetical protein ACFHWX_10155 [Bacteroidota bacterium]